MSDATGTATSNVSSLPRHILLAEDLEDDAFIFRRALQTAKVQFSLSRVRNGQEAIQYLAAEPPFENRLVPSLIVLDLKMPEKSGFDVLEWLRAQPEPAHIPVMILTASDWPADREKAERFDIAAYYMKPVGFDDLVEIVKKIPATPSQG